MFHKKGIRRGCPPLTRAIACALMALGLVGPAHSSTRVGVSLAPNPEVVGAGSVVVSFGFPLPPGVVSSDAQIRVLDAGNVEIPSHVRSLGPWRTLPPIRLRSFSVRAP